MTDGLSPYVGAAYEQEFAGDARATAYGYPIGVPSLSGNTTMIELGLNQKTSKSMPLFIDLGAQDHVGARRAMAGTLYLHYDF